MEEKPRGEKSFWLVSTDWPWSEGNQEVSAAQHQDRKASGTISTYFRGAGGAIYYPEQVTGGLSVTLMCKQLRGIRCRPAFTLMINHSAFSACLAFLTSDSSQCSVIIQHTDWSHFCIRIVKKKKKSDKNPVQKMVFSVFRRISHVLQHISMQKHRLYLIRYIHFWSQKNVSKSEFKLFRNLREENMDLLPTKQTNTLCSHDVFGPLYVCFYLKWWIDIQLCNFNTKWPLSKIHHLPNLCIP